MTDVRRMWDSSGAGIRLILINCLVYILILLLNSIFHLMNQAVELETFINLLQLPGSLKQLAGQPWSLFTHMFVHLGFWHLLFNMITLYFSVQLFTRYFNEKLITGIYLFSGFAGALIFLISVNIFPLFQGYSDKIQALGASAATMGVLMATCFFRPGDEVVLFGFLRLRLGIVALVFILLDLAQIGSGSNEAGHLAHLGGAFFGYFWAFNMKRGRNISDIPKIFKTLGKRSKLKVSHNKRIIPQEADENYNLSKRERQKKVDEILDKISRSGYDSLNSEEKRILFEISKEQ